MNPPALPPHKKWIAMMALLITLVLWSSAYVVIRIGLQGFDPGALGLFRYIIASLVMLFIYIKWGKR